MFYIYVLENPKRQWYTGYSKNLNLRLKKHHNDAVYSTMRIGGPWRLIYYEACLNELDARKREKFLKTGRGKQFIKNRLKYYLKS